MSTALICNAGIDLPEGSVPPALWSTGDIRLSLDHVVSYFKDGSPASRLGDLSWDWTSYHPRGQKIRFSFIYWRRNLSARQIASEPIDDSRIERIRDLQHLMSLVIYKRDGCALSAYSLVHYQCVFVWLALYAEANSMKVVEVLSSAGHLEAFIDKTPVNQYRTLASLLRMLYKLDPVTDLGFKIAAVRNFETLMGRYRQYQDRFQQTPPIPVRIYSELISALSHELDEAADVLDDLTSLCIDSARQHAIESQKGSSGSRVRGFQNLLPNVSPKLLKYLDKRGYGTALRDLSVVLSDIQVVCKFTIHAFSGARDQEVLYLPYFCLEIEKSLHGKKHFVFKGMTTKLEGGRCRKTRWVTSQLGERAIRIAQKVADIIYAFTGCLPRSGNDKEEDNLGLFISTSYLPWSNQRPATTEWGGFRCSKSLGLHSVSQFIQKVLCPIILEEDIEELEQIDPDRDWRNDEKFQVGQPWPLATHQMRRSLALYAQRSGLVRLSSLRRQLQHITREMTAYYSRGSLWACNFIEDDHEHYAKHICKEWREAMSESSCIAFIRDAILSDEPLLGGAGNFIDQQKKRGTVLPREELMKRFKQGLMVYKANPLGGCTNVVDCKKEGKGLSVLDVDCLESNCKYLVAKQSNIINVIPYQRNLVKSLPCNSVEYAIEKRELDVLVAVASRENIVDVSNA